MELRTAISLGSLRRPFRQALTLAAQLGAQGVAINARTDLQPQAVSHTGLRQIRKWLSDYRLSVACVSFPTRRGLYEADDLDRRLEGARRAMTLAAALGCRVTSLTLNDWSGLSSPGSDVLKSALHDLAAYSLRAGAWPILRVGSEPAADIRELLQALPEGSVGIDFDPAATLMHGQSPIAVLDAMGPWVRHVRIRDATRAAGSSRGVEVQLGRGEVDYPALLGRLEECRYRGFFTIERAAADEDSVEACRLAVEFLQQIFA